MRVVLDTNVLIASFIAHGTCNELVEHCFLRHEVVISKPVLDELRKVLVEKFGFSKAEVDRVVRLVRSRALRTDPAPLPQPVCRDADDDIVLATALEAECAVIVSGDKDLTSLGTYQGVTILSPADFWKFEAGF